MDKKDTRYPENMVKSANLGSGEGDKRGMPDSKSLWTFLFWLGILILILPIVRAAFLDPKGPDVTQVQAESERTTAEVERKLTRIKQDTARIQALPRNDRGTSPDSVGAGSPTR
jgi:hypothetical protein